MATICCHSALVRPIFRSKHPWRPIVIGRNGRPLELAENASIKGYESNREAHKGTNMEEQEISYKGSGIVSPLWAFQLCVPPSVIQWDWDLIEWVIWELCSDR